MFTRVFAHLAEWTAARRIFGIYAEATAAHPYSQQASLDLGANESGVLLAWIPASVSNDASVLVQPRRASVVLFYLSTNRAHAHPVYAPRRQRDMVITSSHCSRCSVVRANRPAVRAARETGPGSVRARRAFSVSSQGSQRCGTRFP